MRLQHRHEGAEQTLNREDAAELLSWYAQDAVTHVQRLPVALTNEVYEFDTTNHGRFVVRLLRDQSPQNARLEARLQQALLDNGIVSPQYLVLRNNDVVGVWHAVPFTLSRFIKGRPPAKRTNALAYNFGQTLTRVHEAWAGCNVHIPTGPEHWLNITTARQNMQTLLSPRIKALSNQMEHAYAQFASLPQTIIYGDLRLDNVFATNGQITAVFDFETAERTYRILDLTRTFLNLMYTGILNGQTVHRNLVEGYNSAASQPLTVAELNVWPSALAYTAIACAAWLANHDMSAYADRYIKCADQYVAESLAKPINM